MIMSTSKKVSDVTSARRPRSPLPDLVEELDFPPLLPPSEEECPPSSYPPYPPYPPPPLSVVIAVVALAVDVAFASAAGLASHSSGLASLAGVEVIKRGHGHGGPVGRGWRSGNLGCVGLF